LGTRELVKLKARRESHREVEIRVIPTEVLMPTATIQGVDWVMEFHLADWVPDGPGEISPSPIWLAAM